MNVTPPPSPACSFCPANKHAGSFAQAIRAKGSLLQGSYHIQMLTMSLYLASRGVGREYGEYAVEFK